MIMSRILVVDDDANFARALDLYLRKAGYAVSVALSGGEGLQQVARDRPDLVILDVMMPDMDGFEVCRRLRSNPDTSRLPVLMFTARMQITDKIGGFEAGADDYVTKPAHLAEVLARVKALLRRTATRSPGDGAGD
jgi:DNA-binding response OmpR family regulator